MKRLAVLTALGGLSVGAATAQATLVLYLKLSKTLNSLAYADQ